MICKEASSGSTVSLFAEDMNFRPVLGRLEDSRRKKPILFCALNRDHATRQVHLQWPKSGKKQNTQNASEEPY
jgi:hypothetical protein